MPQLHIINVGNSLLSKLSEEGLIEKKPFSEEDYWKSISENKTLINRIYEKVKLNPQKYSAELNSFLHFVGLHKQDYSQITIYLSGTTTSSNNISLEIIRKYLRTELQCNVLNPKEVSGYFFEASAYDSGYAIDEFTEGISNILDTFIGLAQKKKKEGYEVFFNPTGGFKAHVIACAIAAVLTQSQMYYIHEEFKKLVIFPPLFYLPKGNEIKILQQLSDKKPISGEKFKQLEKQYPGELERLNSYRLISIEYNDDNLPYRARITNAGLYFLELKTK